MNIKAILESPRLYQWFQEYGGFFGARLKAIERLLPLHAGQKVIDIGCGPGNIVEHLPAGIEYVGFDIDETYINHARKTYGNKATFHCQFFDDAAAAQFGGADVIMMNGVLHHIPDEELVATLASVRAALKPDGVLFTLDGVILEKQSTIARVLINNDRGRYVRTPDGYTKILATQFSDVEPHVFEDISAVPYSFFVAISRTASGVL